MYTRSGRLKINVPESSPSRSRKVASPPRSPARTRKSSPPPSSPSRRSRAGKSPSRKPGSKFPARKSPSRVTKTENVSPSKPTVVKQLEVKVENYTAKVESYNTRTRRSEYILKNTPASLDRTDYSVSDSVNGVEPLTTYKELYGLRNRKFSEDFIPRRSSRLRESTDYNDAYNDRTSISKSISKSLSKSVSKSVDRYSDDDKSDDFAREKSQSVTRKLATPMRESVSKFAQINSRWEFGGRIGTALLIFVLPLFFFSILLSCSKLCTSGFLLVPTEYLSLSVWFDTQSFLIIAVHFVVQAILALLPVFGRRADCMDGTGNKYCFNALFASIVTLILLNSLHIFNVFDINIILNNYIRLAFASYIYAVILSVILYAKSWNIDNSKLNLYGNTGYTLYDFFMGREIHPYFRSLNIKIWISRLSNINALIIAGLIFKEGIFLERDEIKNITLENYKQVLGKIELKPTVLVYSLMQIIYILYFTIREYKITTTFYWQSEGVGYLQTVSSALYPFFFMTVSKFLVDSELVLTTNTLIVASITYALGFFIMLASNHVKYEFRKNPLHPSLAGLDSMPTFHGKKLLLSGWWGTVRHPNYLGDMLVLGSLCVPAVCAGRLAAGGAGALAAALVLRARRDHARCARRYGAAWQRYCARVPSIIIPKVF